MAVSVNALATMVPNRSSSTPNQRTRSCRWCSTSTSEHDLWNKAYLSQGFDRARGGIERNWNPDWKLTDFKTIMNEWHVDLPRLGGWMSN